MKKQPRSLLISEDSYGKEDDLALASDAARGIKPITYDNFCHPVSVDFSTFGSVQNVYSASGGKLKTTHATSLNGAVTGKTTTECRGNVIYRDGKVDMVLFPGGYATVSGTAVTFHYYTQDYLGNNRAVINGSMGAIEHTTVYFFQRSLSKSGPDICGKSDLSVAKHLRLTL